MHSATSTVYAPAQRATGPGRVTGIGRTGAVVGPWPGGAVVEGGNGLGFTTFAAAVLGAAAIFLVPPACRARRGPAAQQASAAGRCDRLTPHPALPCLASDVIGRARKPCRPETLTNRASWDQNQEAI